MIFLVLAHDGRDAEALERRLAVREAHLKGLAPAVESGRLQVGGALLDDEGRMIGSMLVVEAESRQDLDDFLKADIYSRHGVWRRFEVYPFKRAV